MGMQFQSISPNVALRNFLGDFTACVYTREMIQKASNKSRGIFVSMNIKKAQIIWPESFDAHINLYISP